MYEVSIPPFYSTGPMKPNSLTLHGIKIEKKYKYTSTSYKYALERESLHNEHNPTRLPCT